MLVIFFIVSFPLTVHKPEGAYSRRAQKQALKETKKNPKNFLAFLQF